nr:hypothetical protein [Tanacetum cinerariifolium]
MLGISSDIIFKEINMRSRSKRGDSVIASEEMESWEDASDVSVGKEGFVNSEESSKIFKGQSKGISNGMDVNVGSNGSNVAVKVKMVTENHILNLDFSGNTKPKTLAKVSFKEVKRPSIFKVSGVNLFTGVKSVSNFELGEESRVNDMNVGDKGSVKKPFSSINAFTSDKISGNNKLKYVVGLVNNFGREVVELDPMIKDGSAK